MEPGFYTAHITVIPKSERDPLSFKNHQPISLLNMDIKVLTFTIAQCINRCLTALIEIKWDLFQPTKLK